MWFDVQRHQKLNRTELLHYKVNISSLDDGQAVQQLYLCISFWFFASFFQPQWQLRSQFPGLKTTLLPSRCAHLHFKLVPVKMDPFPPQGVNHINDSRRGKKGKSQLILSIVLILWYLHAVTCFIVFFYLLYMGVQEDCVFWQQDKSMYTVGTLRMKPNIFLKKLLQTGRKHGENVFKFTKTSLFYHYFIVIIINFLLIASAVLPPPAAWTLITLSCLTCA